MNSLVRVFLSLSTLGLISICIYYGSVEIINIYSKISKQKSLEKIISVKPENIKGNQTLDESWSVGKEKYTFFDTLDDPSMSKFIGLDNNYSEKKIKNNFGSNSKLKNKFHRQINNLNDKEVSHKIFNEKTIQQLDKYSTPGFILQVGSFKNLEMANLLKENLNKKDYPAVIVTAPLPLEGDTWHRVIIGKFLQKEAAVEAAMRVKELENLDSIIKWQEGQK